VKVPKRTRSEGAEENQDEGKHGQDHVPPAKAASLLLHHRAVEKSGGSEPGQQPGILHRVPAPVPTPPQHVVGPASAEQEPQPEEEPGCQCPAAGGGGPVLHLPRDQRGQGKGEGYRQPHVAQVQGGRVEDHAGMAQQGVQPLPVGRHRRQLRKRIGEKQGHGGEEGGDEAEENGCPRNQGAGPIRGIAHNQGGKEGLQKGP